MLGLSLLEPSHQAARKPSPQGETTCNGASQQDAIQKITSQVRKLLTASINHRQMNAPSEPPLAEVYQLYPGHHGVEVNCPHWVLPKLQVNQ